MKALFRFGAASALALTLATSIAAEGRQPLSFRDLVAMKRVSDAQISPDGKQVAFVISIVDREQNRSKRSIWIVPATGGEPHQLITSERNDETPRWSRDGRWLAFISSRAGTPQVFVAAADGSNPRQVTKVPEGVGELLWSPDGKTIAFTTEVYPECRSLACTAELAADLEKSKVKAVYTDKLLFRHWNSFKLGKASHLFVVAVDGGEPRDLTAGDRDVPPFSLGDPTAFDFSPDGKEVAFTRNTDKVEAISTNNDIFIVPVEGGDAKRITNDNPGSDTTPRYSPDGRWIAYRSQARNGYESDRFRLMLYDRTTRVAKELSTNFDRWVNEIVWAPDSTSIFLVAEDRGRQMVGVASITGGVKPLIEKTSSDGLTLSSDGRTLAFTRSSIVMPAEVFRANADGSSVTQLTKVNAEIIAGIDINPAEDFEYPGATVPPARSTKVARGKPAGPIGRAQAANIHGFIIKPPKFSPAKKYPMVLLIHGGPQGAWLDSWGYRWNPQMWAARGYVVVMINPHGSTGYGQRFTEQISGDWAGAVYDDLMKGVDYVISQGYVDPERIGAAGGSYGGYMVNWILGHSDRFKALVSHAGVYNLVSMYGVTEELWFPEWEFKGVPWEHPELYQKWSPHLSAKNFKTPTLVVHGELDYRVPVGEGLQLFTTLQRQNVPSKLLYFPDEGHWVLKPQNSELWYRVVLGWFDQWLKPNGP
ncbi:MAG: S9 family peptidase [Acidobacteriota bacterium]